GLSATQRPLDEVARFLGGAQTAGRTSTSRRDAGAKRPRYDDQNADTEIEHEFSTERTVRYRDVTIVDAGKKKELKLTIEVPVEDMAKLTTADDIPSGPAAFSTVGPRVPGDTRPSIWAAIHPRLLDLIRAHRSTLIFVNSRRLA